MFGRGRPCVRWFVSTLLLMIVDEARALGARVRFEWDRSLYWGLHDE